MPSQKLKHLMEQFDNERTSFDTVVYHRYLREALDENDEVIRSDPARYFSFIEDVLDMLFYSYGGGTLSADERESLLYKIRKNWNSNLDSSTKMSMAVAATYLVPHPGAAQWLHATASTETDVELAKFLQNAALTQRETFVI